MSRISSVLFLFLMGVWVGIILLATNVNYLSLPSIDGITSAQLENAAGFIGFASGALGILGYSIKNKWIQVVALSLLTGFFMFIGLSLAFPVVRTGSNYLIIAAMCLWAVYRRV